MMTHVYILADSILILGAAFLVPAVLIVVIEWLVLRYMCGRPPPSSSGSTC